MQLIHFIDSKLSDICVGSADSLLSAMAVMNKNSLRLVPVISSESGEFFGVLADGDIRRFLANGGSISEAVKDAANTVPKLRTSPLEAKDARQVMQRVGVEYLPVVCGGKITDLFVLWAINSPLNMTAVIMAGGLGTRLAPLTEECPKPLVEIGDKPILTHIIEHLRGQGVTSFVLAVNYLGQMIVDHYGDGSSLDVNISYIHEEKRLGTGGALSLVAEKALSEPFLCMNGDILTDVDVNALFEAHRENNWSGTMVTREHKYVVPYGVIRNSPTGEFLGSDEKPTMAFAINAGIYMLSKNSLPLIPEDTFFDLPTLFERLRERHMSVGTFAHDGRWIDIGSMSELDRARAIFTGKK